MPAWAGTSEQIREELCGRRSPSEGTARCCRHSMKVAGLTHVGNVRSTNEDTILQHLTEPYYILVADGMGGHAAGEVASSIAAQSISAHLNALDAHSIDADQLVDAIQYANSRILEEMEEHPEYTGMGTTITLAYLRPESVLVAHVGDSSAFLLRDGQLRKITRDHTYVQKLIDCGVLKESASAKFPFRNVITRALGMPQVQVDMYCEQWSEGDYLVLCSDGLTTYVDADHLQQELSSGRSLEEQSDRLLQFALGEGGRDNISIVIAQNCLNGDEHE